MCLNEYNLVGIETSEQRHNLASTLDFALNSTALPTVRPSNTCTTSSFLLWPSTNHLHPLLPSGCRACLARPCTDLFSSGLACLYALRPFLPTFLHAFIPQTCTDSRFSHGPLQAAPCRQFSQPGPCWLIFTPQWVCNLFLFGLLSMLFFLSFPELMHQA